MTRARALLWLSLGLNLALTGLIVLLSRDSISHSSSVADLNSKSTNGIRTIKTNVVVRRQPFNWRDIESPDYPTYIANLRRIGCPERTIRDIIVADVNELFNERIAREVVLPEQQWWLPEPNMDVFQAAADQLRAFEDQKNLMLAQLLGPGWTNQTRGIRGDPIRLDGPVLGQINSETRARLFEIEANSRRAREAYFRQTLDQGREADPAQIARLAQQTRNELAAILTPEQLEEYLLRYSQNSDSLRQQLRGFGAGADEYRRIFRARDPYDQQLALLTGNDPASARRRQELEAQRDAAVKDAVGAERFPLYMMTQNPLFKEAQDHAEQNGAPPEKVIPIFQVRQAAQEEIARIQASKDLSVEEQRAALKLIEEHQRASIDRILNGVAAAE